ncbi:hypothetical protein [Fluviicola sp.]|jgi:phosphopantetheinyl transferase (holo-ACP synthase)|uniref:4'-phosphopantetheinyl transferase family protein n=1 Tax=Fluviicola sp. TaxID=1917219 RepID=UPI0028213863|nr:hypothetical protein [Fluviicola sp.]MDR0801449.1 4'-phosphopantetheinyl transferase superfamily protein [Fluviicola sp.]
MISIINNPDSVVAYFRQENYEILLKNGANKRDLEKKGTRRLLDALGYENLKIAHKPSGQPYVEKKPDLHLSVSHSCGWFAVMVGLVPVGIDIQVYSERLQAGQDYFRNERESAFSEDEQALHLIWCAKEAFYKLKTDEIADLKEDVSMLRIAESMLWIDFEGAGYFMNYKLLEGAFLVFVSGKNNTK